MALDEACWPGWLGTSEWEGNGHGLGVVKTEDEKTRTGCAEGEDSKERPIRQAHPLQSFAQSCLLKSRPHQRTGGRSGLWPWVEESTPGEQCSLPDIPLRAA